MSYDYESLRKSISRCVVPIPIVYRDDLSIDYDGLERYTAWLMELGIKNMCLTFMYSQIDSLTVEEIVAVTRSIAAVIGDRGVFISCTQGGSVATTVDLVRRFQEVGAHAAFVQPTQRILIIQNGDLYVNYLRCVARQTDLPILCVALAPAPASPPLLSEQHFDKLVEDDHFVGYKDDVYVIPYRLGLARRFGDRLCVIGGGMLRQYVHFHRYPNQAEFAGLTDPRRSLQFFELLDGDRYAEAIAMLDEIERCGITIANLHGLACNQVRFYAMGFSQSYRIRPPLVSATEDQARGVMEHMRKFPGQYEHILI